MTAARGRTTSQAQPQVGCQLIVFGQPALSPRHVGNLAPSRS